MKVKSDHRSKFSNFSNWKEEAWKISGLQRDSNPWPPRYRCDARPTELWSHTLGTRSICWVHWERGKLVGFISSRTVKRCEIYYIYNLNYSKNMDFIYISYHFAAREDTNSTNWPRSQCVASQLSWSSIAPVSRRSRVQISLNPWYPSGFFQLLKFENLLQWSLFTFIYNRSTNMDFIHISHCLHIALTLSEQCSKIAKKQPLRWLCKRSWKVA